MFSCEFFKIFKKKFFIELLREIASEICDTRTYCGVIRIRFANLYPLLSNENSFNLFVPNVPFFYPAGDREWEQMG